MFPPALPAITPGATADKPGALPAITPRATTDKPAARNTEARSRTRAADGGCRVLYLSPLKALAVDVERNLRAPIAGIGRYAAARGDAFHTPAVAVRTGDTPQAERARFQREPA